MQPPEQRGAEVEAHAGVVVDDADDLVLEVGDAGGAVGGVALGGDAVVPVVIGRGGVLDLDGLEPGVFARRLVEVAVDADEAAASCDREVGLCLLRYLVHSGFCSGHKDSCKGNAGGRIADAAKVVWIGFVGVAGIHLVKIKWKQKKAGCLRAAGCWVS